MELPADLGDALADAFRRIVPGARSARATTGGYQTFFASAADGIRQARALSEPEQWQVDWECSYTRDEWLETMATGGGFNRLDPTQLDALLANAGAVIHAMGGSVIVKYATVAVTALRLTLILQPSSGTRLRMTRQMLLDLGECGSRSLTISPGKEHLSGEDYRTAVRDRGPGRCPALAPRHPGRRRSG
jgi:hypothetical protein